MTVATELLNSTKAAELIRERTGRGCSRQTLEELCRKGRLPRSCVSLKPIRLDPVMLLAEYASSVQERNPPRREAPTSVVDQAPRSVPQRVIKDSDLPDYNESRARSEYERANLLELERKQKEGLLLPAEQVEKVWANSVTIARTKLLGVPTRLRQRIPHLTLEEIAIAEELIRESLEELAGGEDDGE